MKRELFYTGVRDIEREMIFTALDNFESPIYTEIGVQYGGTFQKVLQYMDINFDTYHAYGIDLFEEAWLEEKNFKIGWPKRTQTHDIGGDFGLNVSSEQQLDEALRDIGFKNFTLMKGYSDNVIQKIPDEIDVIFIDGNHTYNQTKKDFTNCFKKSKVGTFFMLHNTTEDEYKEFYRDGGPYKLCNEIAEDERLEYIGMSHTTKSFRRIK